LAISIKGSGCENCSPGGLRRQDSPVQNCIKIGSTTRENSRTAEQRNSGTAEQRIANSEEAERHLRTGALALLVVIPAGDLLFLSSAVPLFRCSAVLLFRCSAVPLFRYSAILLFCCSAVLLFRYSAIPLFRYSAAVLDLLKAAFTAGTIVAIYRVGVAAFFTPASRWEDRVLEGLIRLALAVCIALAGGVLFVWPSRRNPDRGKPFLTALPVQMLLWATVLMTILFAASLYLTCAQNGWAHPNYLNCS